jgi:serine/threonine-protein kinase
LGQTLELSMEGEVRGPGPDPMLGRRLLHYRVIEVIGQGGMSVVYRGRDEHLARDVAIKVLHPFLAEKPECRTRLAREARAVARLEHPNILQVFDFSGDAPTLNEKPGHEIALNRHEGFIIAELVKGPTLKRFGERHAIWRAPEVGALIIWQLLQALQHAHDNGIVHRDLKPENVMVRDDGTLKLMDFGIAQIADQGGLTVTGTLLGSPAHMAPECIDGLPADERSDLFSLGTVLYWITTGSLPFEALTPHALLKQIVDGRMTPAQQKSPRISDELQRVMTRAMATAPNDRYASARDFGDALKDVIVRAGLAADDTELRNILRDPDARLPQVKNTVRQAFMDRAQAAFADGQMARAMSCLNRVLADDPGDADARALLDTIHKDDPATEGDVDRNDAEAAAAAAAAMGVIDTLPPLSSTLSSSSLSSSMDMPTTTAASAPPFRWQSLLVGAAAVAMVAAAVTVARAVDGAVVGPAAAVSPPQVDETFGTSSGEPAALVNDGSGKGPPPAADDDAPVRRPKQPNPTTPKGAIVGIQTPIRVGTPSTTTTAAVKAGATADGVTLAPKTRKVVFRVKPWADIVVDGVVLAKNTMAYEADLPEGAHKVTFMNPRAKDHEVRFVVSGDGPPPLVTARLEPRPALLSVRTNVGDAFVDVKGVGKPAQDTVSRPLVVTLDEQSKAEREVFIYKKGYMAYRHRHTFVAGETLQLDVVLEPDPGDAGDKPPE